MTEEVSMELDDNERILQNDVETGLSTDVVIGQNEGDNTQQPQQPEISVEELRAEDYTKSGSSSSESESSVEESTGTREDGYDSFHFWRVEPPTLDVMAVMNECNDFNVCQLDDVLQLNSYSSTGLSLLANVL